MKKNINDVVKETLEDKGRFFRSLYLRPINKEAVSDEMLEKHVYTRMEDIVFMLVLRVSSEQGNNASAFLTKELVANYGYSELELFKRAFDNVRLTVKVNDLGAAYDACIAGENAFNPATMSFSSGSPIVITNNKQSLGAACMALDDMIERIDSAVGGAYILPSSIHEIIMMPVRTVDDPEYLRNMVRDINENQVRPEERLSNNIYKYDYNLKRIVTV